MFALSAVQFLMSRFVTGGERLGWVGTAQYALWLACFMLLIHVADWSGKI